MIDRKVERPRKADRTTHTDVDSQLLSLVQAALAAKRVAGLLKQSLHALAVALRADLARLVQLKSPRRAIVIGAGAAWSDPGRIEIELDDRGTPTFRAVASGRPQWVESQNAGALTPNRAASDGEALRGVVVPIAIADDGCFGTLEAYVRPPRRLAKSESHLVEAAAAFLSLAIERQRTRDADRRCTRLLSVCGHDLRNAVAPISYAVEIARLGQAEGKDTSQLWPVIEEQVRETTRLLDELSTVWRRRHECGVT